MQKPEARTICTETVIGPYEEYGLMATERTQRTGAIGIRATVIPPVEFGDDAIKYHVGMGSIYLGQHEQGSVIYVPLADKGRADEELARNLAGKTQHLLHLMGIRSTIAHLPQATA